MTKENNGRAARKVLIRRLTVVLISFLICIGSLHLLGVGQAANRNRNHDHDAASDKSRSLLRDMVRRQQIQRPHPSQPKQQQTDDNSDSDPDIIYASFDSDSSTDPDIIHLLLNAEVHLVEISMSREDDQQITGEFCTLNFAAHKEDPSAVPMFRHLVEASPECAKIRYRVNLRDYVEHAKEYDSKHSTTTKALTLGAVVFHESRCGSTLVANALVAMNPAKHRVYSESPQPLEALKNMCGESYHSCTRHRASEILQQVFYAMSRTNDLKEERVFFKIQSIGTRNIQVFQDAFPTTHFLFVYRDPVHVLMSQLSHGAKNANCMHTRRNPPSSVLELCRRQGLQVKKLKDEEYCAAHLASITEAALLAIQHSNGMGIPVNYVDLPHILWESILPQIGIKVTEEEITNIKTVSTQYSKGADGRQAEFHQDSEQKEKHASEAIKAAAELILHESYTALQELRQ